nr:G-type lectin S-receptor-like serine/threonine-protein kinase At4g27290 [Tanacetum cinerariifolium]
MEILYIPLFFFLLTFILTQSGCTAVDTISANQEIKDGETIISEGQMYEMGFFSPGNSMNRYLGIWFKKISTGTVVWVANRDTPITDKSGTLKVNKDGNLVILSGGINVIWSSNSNVGLSSSDPVVVQLLDTGNLVVRVKSSTNQTFIWQSFDYHCDTLLAGMKFGKDLVTGFERYGKSWKSPDDPSIGVYSQRMDTNGYPQIFKREGHNIISRLGPWNGLGFTGSPVDVPNLVFSTDFVVNQKEIYYRFEHLSSVVQRIVLTWDGRILKLQWIERSQEWIVYADVGVYTCGRFALCGPYGSCSMNRPPCTCIKGFEPKNKEEWDASDWSSGCQRKTPLKCGSEYGFQKMSGMKLPDTRTSWYNFSMALGECEMTCRRNCSCTAYANLDIRNGGSGCLLWFDELIDITEFEDEEHEIYIRMAASELTGNMVNKRKKVLTVVIPILLATLILAAAVHFFKKKKKNLHMKKQGDVEYALYKKNRSVHMEHLDDIQFFSLYEIAKATDNFSDYNKIGEGGFGPVYKGVLEDGKEVAVKRLSETSQQGLDEFKNELISIAKLQHRNLVKLLGYCIHGTEMILVYEYMANKSLDSFIFDETRSLMIDWPKRFHIIHGMARGILYLHQDSRLQIIHRDLKAGNILLDSAMNPKISDFGLARKFVGNDADAKTKKVVGTYGYISPEYAVHGRFSIKSDVFSFGVIVLEIVSGKKNREFCHEDHRDNLLGHAWRLYKENKSIELMSESLRGSCVVSEVLRSIHVALLCVQHHAEDRPTMLSVVLMLVSESALPEPKQPAFFTEECCHELERALSVDERTITLLYAR